MYMQFQGWCQCRWYLCRKACYFADLVAAIEEQVELAPDRLPPSDFTPAGSRRRQLAGTPEGAGRDRANCRRGIQIAFDCYAYVAGSSVLTQLLPGA
jgi:hypothetical protein